MLTDARGRHEHCARNCNDCSSASHGGTGTQCKVFIPVAVGAVYRSRMRRTKIGVTEEIPKEDLCFEGSEAFKDFCDAFDEVAYNVTGNEWTVKAVFGMLAPLEQQIVLRLLVCGEAGVDITLARNWVTVSGSFARAVAVLESLRIVEAVDDAKKLRIPTAFSMNLG